MRVLCVDDLQFKEFQDLPDDDYAVLSHVWGDAEICHLDMKGWSQSEPFSIAEKDEASAKAEDKRAKTASSISGMTPAASTNQIILKVRLGGKNYSKLCVNQG